MSKLTLNNLDRSSNFCYFGKGSSVAVLRQKCLPNFAIVYLAFMSFWQSVIVAEDELTFTAHSQ